MRQPDYSLVCEDGKRRKQLTVQTDYHAAKSYVNPNFTILPSLTILGTVTPIFGSIYANSPGQICSVRYRLVGAHVVADDAHPFLLYLMSAYAPKRAIRAPGTQSCRHAAELEVKLPTATSPSTIAREDLITAENLGTHPRRIDTFPRAS